MVQSSLSVTSIEKRIFIIRGQKVMIDRDLADLYGVQTRDLNKAVRRNQERFPDTFAFQLTRAEFEILMFHFGTSRWGGTRKPPLAFTEHGVAMLSAVLRSKRAISMSILIIKAFVRLREIASAHKAISDKLLELEERVGRHDTQVRSIIEALRQLMQPPEKSKRRIGF